MSIKHNNYRRTAYVWFGVIALGVFVFFLPGIIGLEGFDGGFALSVGGGFITMIGIIAGVIYAKLANALDRIVKPENLLAHWTYTQEQWKEYTELEHKEDAEAKKGLFILVAVISVIVGVIFAIFERENPMLIFFIILGIIALVGITALLTSFANYANNKRRLGETFLALDGVYLNRQLHTWKGIGNSLEEAVLEAGEKGHPRVRFEYSSPGRTGRNFYTARIPVPPGDEDNAREVVARIIAAHLTDEKHVRQDDEIIED
jgi:hypothetical protein